MYRMIGRKPILLLDDSAESNEAIDLFRRLLRTIQNGLFYLDSSNGYTIEILVVNLTGGMSCPLHIGSPVSKVCYQ
jgi:hypothetical protein